MRWNPTRRSIGRAGLLVSVGFMAISAGHVRANPIIGLSTLSPPVLAAMTSANKHCIHIAYDKNGNRLTQAGVPVTTTPTTWGSGTYGCFTWSE
jgi:hypothetical protein